MNRTIKMLSLSIALLGLSQWATAQAPGSESVYGGGTSVKSIVSGGFSTDVSESLYIGPGTHQIDGTWEVYARNVVIDPTAVITGTGVIQFYNPSVAGGAASGTLIDGNNASGAIDVNIELRNASGMQLTNIAFPASLTGAGWTNTATASTVYIGRDLNLAVDGADVTLGTGVVGDLKFDNNATISNYRPARMVIVNNSILSHMVKESFTSAFTFPVGIADGDYTPAQISNTSNNTVRVSVQDYSASLSPEALTDGTVNTADGMNRTWHIFGDNPSISSTLNLQHNSSTNQTGFVDASHFITQWGNTIPNTTGDMTVPFSTSPWQTNTQAAGTVGTLSTAGTVAGSSMRNRVYSAGLATIGSANQSYFTKSADAVHPLPIQLLSFGAQARDCDAIIRWEVGSQQDAIAYQLMYSKDGINYSLLTNLSPKDNQTTYSFVHQNVGNGENYYRLKIFGTDGTVSFSPSRLIHSSCNFKDINVKVYPNPTTDLIFVEGMAPDRKFSLRLLSVDGKLLVEQQYNGGIAILSLNALPQSIYILQIIEENYDKTSIRISKN